MLIALLVAVATSMPQTAEAKRLGGGKSFGGRPSYSETYRPSPPSDVGAGMRAPQPAYSPAATRNQAVRDTMRSRGGFLGMLGGLAVGGLLGALLFGGAFEHLNLLDMAVFALVAFMLFRLFASRRQAAWGSATNYSRDASGTPAASPGFDTNILMGRTPAANTAAPKVPEGFDRAAFLGGARNAYRHLQAAWDAGDLQELRALTTDHVFDELATQIAERQGPSITQVLKLDARLLEVIDEAGTQRASVLFDALVKEDESAEPASVREVWHFVRDSNSRQPTWYLDGIQQCEP